MSTRKSSSQKASGTRITSTLKRVALIAVCVLIVVPVLAMLVYRVVPPPGTPLMLARPGDADYRWVDLDAISPHVVRAVIVSEDQVFCAHSGIDWRQMEIVFDELLEDGRPSRGASTITMQTARNLFLPPSRSALRKAVEIPLALGLEAIMPKRRILELYLNVIEWGDGIHGIEAAAQRHFGKPAKALSKTEAARLAAILPNPITRSPTRPSPAVARKAGKIARDVGRVGVLWGCVGT